mgnify:FL=1
MLDFQQYFPYNEVFDFIKNNQILFTVFITILILKMKEISKVNIYLSGIVYFLGTFFHELAHYIIAIITTFRLPGRISLFPKYEIVNGRRVIALGYVEVKNSSLNILNAFPIGMAPLLLLYLAYIVSKYFFIYYGIWFEVGIIAYILQSFLMATLIINSVPSRADLILARTKGSLYFYIVILLISIFYIVYK